MQKHQKTIQIDNYIAYTLPSAFKLFESLEKVMPDLILLDMGMPVMNGCDIVRIPRKYRRYADIPVILIVSHHDESMVCKEFFLEEIDYVTKPFYTPFMLKRIKNHLLSMKLKNRLSTFEENLLKSLKENTRYILKLENAITSSAADFDESKSCLSEKIKKNQKKMPNKDKSD